MLLPVTKGPNWQLNRSIFKGVKPYVFLAYENSEFPCILHPTDIVKYPLKYPKYVKKDFEISNMAVMQIQHECGWIYRMVKFFIHRQKSA